MRRSRLTKSFCALLFIFCSFNVFGQQAIDGLVISNAYSMQEFKGDLWIYGASKTISTPRFYKSNNAIDWTLVGEDFADLHAAAAGVVFNNELYSIAGHKDSGKSNEVFYSADGVNWDMYIAPFPKREKLAACIHDGKIFIVGGAGLNDAWYTEDGRNWVQASDNVAPDFPHFWKPRLVSLNGNLVLFGGHESDFILDQNKRGVYISSDNGANWVRHEFPWNVNLDHTSTYFVFEDKLHLVVNNAPNDGHGQGDVFSYKPKLFVSENGIDWEEMANENLPIVKNADVVSLATVFKGKPISISEKVYGYTEKKIVYAEYETPEIYLQNINNVLKLESDAVDVEVPLNYHFKNSTDQTGISFSFRSSNPDVVPCESLVIENNKLKFQHTGIIGMSEIEVIATDGTNTNAVQFDVSVFSDAKVDLIGVSPQVWATDHSDKSVRIRLKMLNTYGNNSFEFGSSDPSFLDASKVRTFPLGPFIVVDLNDAFLSDDEGEVVLTITATDGVTSRSVPMSVKIGANEAPVYNGLLVDYAWDKSAPLNVPLPSGAFNDPDGDELTYHVEDLPCGLNIDHTTGTISGTTDDELPFAIEIIAKDKYGYKVTASFNITASALSTGELQSDAIELSVMPNPCNEQLIVVANDKMQRLDLFNLNGVQVKSVEVGAKKATVEVNDLPTGHYLIRAVRSDRVSTVRFVKGN